MGAQVRTFRDLKAWQRAMELVEAVYVATKALPEGERFGLTSQMRRASVSIPSNIAEGYGRQNRPDYLRFLRMARGSLLELDTQIELAMKLRLMPAHQELIDLVEEVDRILQALIMSLERKQREAP